MGKKTKLIEARKECYENTDFLLTSDDEEENKNKNENRIILDENFFDTVFELKKTFIDFVTDQALPLCEFINDKSIKEFLIYAKE